jgi:hypothetical protein
MALYDAYDKNSEQQGLGWADQWDYKYNDKYGTEDSTTKSSSSSSNNNNNKDQKLAKVKSAASVGMDKTKSAVSSGAHKVATGTSSGLKWFKDKVQKK